MGHYQDLVERIKRELPIDSLLPGEAQGKRCIRCPLPGHADKAPSFTVYRETNSWICWSHPGGHSAGSVLDYLMAEQGVDFKEAVRLGADKLGIELRPPTPEEKVEAEARHHREDVLTTLSRVAHGWLIGESPLAIQTRAYLHGRGFTEELIKAQLLGLLDIQKLFQIRETHPILAAYSEADFAAVGLRNERGNALFLGPRLAIPILSRQRVTGMTFRALDAADKRKYMHLPGPAGLYNDDAFTHRSREVILTEGIPDCWTLMQWELPAVGNLGVHAVKHAARFQRLERATLVWDNDAAGRGHVLKTARAIQAEMPEGEVCILHVPGAKDINDWAQAGGTEEAFRDLLKQAPDLIEYQIERLPDTKASGRLGREEQQALREILESIAALPELRQGVYLKRLKERCGLQMSSLRASVKELKVSQDLEKRAQAKQKDTDGLGGHSDPTFIFEDLMPYIPALAFDFTQDPVANIGLWMGIDDNGTRVQARYILESKVTKDGLQAALVAYRDRQVNDAKQTRFPDPDLPRWRRPAELPFSVESFLKDPKANSPNTASLFQDIRALLKEFIWYPADYEYDVVSLWIMMSYVYPIFGTLGYLHFNGITGSGKSLSLDFIAALAFNARKTTSITEPALFRLVHANRSTVLLDEAEKLSHPKPGTMEATIRLLLNDAYKKGSSASRTNMDTGTVEMFETFGPKCLGSINEIDHVFGNRCIVIRSLKKQKDVVLRDYAQNAAEIEARAEALRNQLHCWALSTFHLIHGIFTKDLLGALPELISREREIWLPLITIAHLVDRDSTLDETRSLVDIVLKAQKEKETEKDERARRENLDILLLQTLLGLMTGEDHRIYELLSFPHEYFTSKLAEAIHAELQEDGTWPLDRKLTANRLTNVLKTHHVITEDDVRRRVEGGKRTRAIRVKEQPLRDALRRLQGQEDEDDPATSTASPTLPAAAPDNGDDPLPF